MMNELIDLAKQIVERQFLTHMPDIDGFDLNTDREHLTNITAKYLVSYDRLLNLQFNVDHSLGLQQAIISSIYSDMIASDETVERVILNSTIEFRMKADLNEKAWGDLCTTMAQMLHLGPPPSNSKYMIDKDKHKCTPDEVSSRFTTPEINYSILVCNSWLVICILLSFASPINVEISRLNTARNRKGRIPPGNE